MTVIVTGGRDHDLTGDEALWFLRTLGHYRADNVFNGDARGVDRQCANLARDHRFHVVDFPADWEKHGKAAGPIRNAEMLREAQKLGPVIVLAFPGGKGTQHMKDLARRGGVDVMEPPAEQKELDRE